MAAALRLALLGATVAPCFGDVYMHNPRGSNDRNCERNVREKHVAFDTRARELKCSMLLGLLRR